MAVHTQQPQMREMVAELPLEHYQHKLFGCCASPGNCCYTIFCTQCATASARSRYDGSNWCFNCFTLNPCILRNIIREGYNISGVCLQDVVTGTCCGPCVICQNLNEVNTRGKVTQQWGANRSPTPEPWRYRLCGCFANCGSCLFGCLCPACAMAYARAEFDGSSCLFNLCCMNPPLLYNVIREGYNLDGTCVCDCCIPCICGPCAAVRLLNEVADRGKVTKTIVVVPVNTTQTHRP